MKKFFSLFIDETASTNSYLTKEIEKDNSLPNLFTVYTNFQTEGRGMLANKWVSEYGKNLLASIYLNSMVDPSQQFILNCCISLSVRKLIASYFPVVNVKWPNDIYVQDKKIAGILIEHSICANHIQYSIAGIGLNVNQIQFDTSLPNPTSLALLTNRFFYVEKILNELLEMISYYFSFIEQHNYAFLRNEYISYLYKFDQPSHYIIKNQYCEAKIIGVNDYGQLLLQDNNGVDYCCNMKEIKYVL